MKFPAAILILFSCIASRSSAQIVPTPNNIPSILQNVGIDQKLGAAPSPQLIFKDEQGRDVRFGDMFAGRPVILVMVYYQCPMLCTLVMNDLLRTLRAMPETAGRDFDVITVSFDPRDTPSEALLKKKTYLAQYDRPDAENGWHFLTGRQPSITALADAVGFRYAWDAKNQMYAHASGIMIMTPQGKISRYFFGVDYAPQDVRIALDEASNGHVGGLADAILLYCFCYDPATGKYGLAVSRMLKAGGVLTILAVGSFVAMSLRRERGGAGGV
jgi:protein SCO1